LSERRSELFANPAQASNGVLRKANTHLWASKATRPRAALLLRLDRPTGAFRDDRPDPRKARLDVTKLNTESGKRSDF
jgi:hypothetical protein